MILRAYQAEAVSACYRSLAERDGNPCIVMPTGAGKTPIIAQICADAVAWGERVVVLAHVKELLLQTLDKIKIMAPDLPVGVYSAGLNSRDTGHPVIVAGIQSVWRRAEELGPRSLIIIDEAHLISPDDESRYQIFFEDLRAINPDVRVIGLTATPYRLGTGALCGPDETLNHICHETRIQPLIAGGFLSRLVLRGSDLGARADLSGVSVRAGEYVAAELSDAASAPSVIAAATADITAKTIGRKSVLVFAVDIAHGEKVLESMMEAGHNVAMVTGDTPSPERSLMLDQFKAGGIRYLINVMVLTTGFDAPNVDCVVMLRPTLSPGLYYQMVGRGFRVAPGKTNCLILDCAGNIMRHGPVDALGMGSRRGGNREPGDDIGEDDDGTEKMRECPGCQFILPAAQRECVCGYMAPEDELKIGIVDEDSDILQDLEPEWVRVNDASYFSHTKKDPAPGKPSVTLRADYYLGLGRRVCEWVCVEHTGYARAKAETWWAARSDEPLPATVDETLRAIRLDGLRTPSRVRIAPEPGTKYIKLVAAQFGAAQLTTGQNLGTTYEDLPF